MTARQQVVEELQAHPEGMSKSELRQAIGGNNGAFRRLMQSMEDKGEVVVERVVRPNCGLTKVHRLPEQVNA